MPQGVQNHQIFSVQDMQTWPEQHQALIHDAMWLASHENPPQQLNNPVDMTAHLSQTLLTMGIHLQHIRPNQKLAVGANTVDYLHLDAFIRNGQTLTLEQIMHPTSPPEAFKGALRLMCDDMVILPRILKLAGQRPIDWASYVLMSTPQTITTPDQLSITERIQDLHNAGFNLNDAMPFAIKNRDFHAIKELIKLGVSLDIVDNQKNNVMHVLCSLSTFLPTDALLVESLNLLTLNPFLLTDLNEENVSAVSLALEHQPNFKTLLVNEIATFAGAGDNHAMVALGIVYTYGFNGVEDFTQARHLFTQATLNGLNPMASFCLGQLIIEHPQGDADIQLGISLLETAANANITRAQVRLGIMNNQGLYMPKNLDNARAWFKQATEKNNALAHYFLASIPEPTLSEEQLINHVESHNQKAAEQGIPNANSNLSWLYARQAQDFSKNNPSIPKENNPFTHVAAIQLMIGKKINQVHAQQLVSQAIDENILTSHIRPVG